MTYIPGGSSGGSGNVSTSGDVALNNPVNGQALVYDASIAKWVNKNKIRVMKLTRSEFDALAFKDPEVFYALVAVGESAPPSQPKIHTFTDTFDTLDSTKWTIYPGAAALSGELTLDASSSYSTIRTTEYFSIEGSAAQVQINQLPNISNGSTQAWMNFRLDSTNSLTILWTNNVLYCRMSVSGSETEITITYDAATMRVWRLREADGVLYWETSATGQTWVSHRSVAIPSAWIGAAGQVSLVAGNWNSASSPGQAKFDNFNVSNFFDLFTATDGSSWDTTKWSLSPLLGATADISSNRGKLFIPDTDGAMVRAIAETPTMTNQNLLMSYTLTDTSARTWIQIWLRSDGTWSGNKPGSGYAVEIRSDASNVAILKYKAGAQTGLSSVSSVNSLTAGQKQWLRFEVSGNTIRYRIWADGATEPTIWTASVVDNELTAAGRFQFCAYRSTANIGDKTFYLDDVLLADNGAEATSSEPSTGLALDEQMNGTYTLSYSNNGAHPRLVVEHNGLTPINIGSGTLKIYTGSTEYHRVYFASPRYGGPGKPMIIRYRVRVNKFHQTVYHNTTAGANVWWKFPHDSDPQESWKDVISGGTYRPTTIIMRTGFSPNGRVENTVFDGYQEKYISYGSPKDIGYALGSWKDVTIRAEFVSSDRVRLRYWHNSTSSGTPIYDWTGDVPAHNKPGFLCFRTDFCDAEYDYFTVAEG